LVERAPEKREVTGSTPVPTTSKALVSVGAPARASSLGRAPCHAVPLRSSDKLMDALMGDMKELRDIAHAHSPVGTSRLVAKFVRASKPPRRTAMPATG
jgi:hypothetical protein